MTCYQKLKPWESARQEGLRQQNAPSCVHCGCRYGDSHQRDQRQRTCRPSTLTPQMALQELA